MRVEVLNPLKHEGVDHEVGSFIELEEPVVRMLIGAVGQVDVPAPAPAIDPAPAHDDPSPDGDEA